MPRATHSFAFGILFVAAAWGAAILLSQTAARTGPNAAAAPAAAAAGAGNGPLWGVYERLLKHARYVDLTHTITPAIPVWPGFGRSAFGPAVDPKTGRAYSYARDGFEATRYELATDQLGTQLDPPAHWNPDYPAIDELP
ncbi:MAG: cyclase family protein, partial [Acidobacteria bacterium]|nr:cyclase family protein [Acidobacteriota bacterium]